MTQEQKRMKELQMNRIKELQEKLIEEFTPYDSWEEFLHEREQYKKGNFQEQGK